MHLCASSTRRFSYSLACRWLAEAAVSSVNYKEYAPMICSRWRFEGTHHRASASAEHAFCFSPMSFHLQTALPDQLVKAPTFQMFHALSNIIFIEDRKSIRRSVSFPSFPVFSYSITFLLCRHFFSSSASVVLPDVRGGPGQSEEIARLPLCEGTMSANSSLQWLV